MTYGAYGKGTIADSDLTKLQQQAHDGAVNSPLGRISGPLLKSNLLREGNDLRFQNQLLYLDVTNKTLSINSTPINKQLYVNGTLKTTDLIVDAPKVTAGNLELGPGDLIKANTGTIILSAIDYVLANEIQTDDISITDNVISTITTNTNIEVRPTGLTDVYSSVNVYGNLHANGNITADGDVIFGNDSSDNVTFNSDVKSDLIPDLNEIYNLGLDGKRWDDIYVKYAFGNLIYTDVLETAGLNLALRPGKIWYVATNGLDTNRGNHQSGPFATITKALSVALDGDTVHIYPGTYTEIFPLTVPVGVTVVGVSLRSVSIQPTVGTNHNDAFLLNGETTVNNVTVTNFFYDSVNDTGYAFRFAPGAKTTTRSPYVQNVSVLTKGSVTSTADPLGFLQGDAGKGALADGSVMDASTTVATMLFHSVTFITPGVDALTMTNGVRIEWLNSFTYFANRSLYATQGTLGLSGLGVTFGAEVRAIASASVYGNYGAVADGVDTLMYLIQYNFGYVGAGLDSSNDKTLVIQANEVTELNSGKVYYQSVDQQGNYRVGDQFYVDFDNGTTSIDINSGAVDGISSMTIGSGANITFIGAEKVDIGDFTIRNDTISTRGLTFNIVSSTGEVSLTQNASIAKNLAVTGDVTIDGIITVGNQTSDTVGFVADIASNLVPDTTLTYTLGTTTKLWDNLHAVDSYVDGIKISTNEITVLDADTNLELLATGKISVPTNNVEVTNDLEVSDTSNLNETVVVGNIIHTGATDQTGNKDITGIATATVSGKFSDITFSGNTIHSDNSLNISLLSGQGKLNIVSNNADISIKNNRIINNKNDPIIFSTNGGYVKFAGTGAMAIPVGAQGDRPVAPESGTVRFNSTSGSAEVYTQPTDTWSSVTGLGEIATREIVEEYGNLWILILG